ncbi:Uncharacterised protein [Klebsiella pneumoniae]|nr:Uncharacterised protein [Klebsiella pneumoniae]HBY9743232.1 hypothetical protein [Klebsiella pneumoniae]HBY9792782.1 hypothetical protein [Klebsiella pneumoniae]
MSNPKTEQILLARRQIKRLETMHRTLTEMGGCWDGLDCGMESDLESLAARVELQIKINSEMIEEWRHEKHPA